MMMAVSREREFARMAINGASTPASTGTAQSPAPTGGTWFSNAFQKVKDDWNGAMGYLAKPSPSAIAEGDRAANNVINHNAAAAQAHTDYCSIHPADKIDGCTQ